MDIPKNSPTASQHPGKHTGGNGMPNSIQLLEKAHADTDTVLKELGSQLNGLTEAEAASRLKRV